MLFKIPMTFFLGLVESWDWLDCNLTVAWHRGHQAALAYRGLKGFVFSGLLLLQQTTVWSSHLESVKADPFNSPLFLCSTESFLISLFYFLANTFIWDYLLSDLENNLATLFRVVIKIYICLAFSHE